MHPITNKCIATSSKKLQLLPVSSPFECVAVCVALVQDAFLRTSLDSQRRELEAVREAQVSEVRAELEQDKVGQSVNAHGRVFEKSSLFPSKSLQLC